MAKGKAVVKRNKVWKEEPVAAPVEVVEVQQALVSVLSEKVELEQVAEEVKALEEKPAEEVVEKKSRKKKVKDEEVKPEDGVEVKE